MIHYSHIKCDHCGERHTPGNPEECIEILKQQKNDLMADMIAMGSETEEIGRLRKENHILKVKCRSSLANNLCPDHRDKQGGKSCLACEIDRLWKA